MAKFKKKINQTLPLMKNGLTNTKGQLIVVTQKVFHKEHTVKGEKKDLKKHITTTKI